MTHDEFNKERMAVLVRKREQAKVQKHHHEQAGFETLAQLAQEDVDSLGRQIDVLANAMVPDATQAEPETHWWQL